MEKYLALRSGFALNSKILKVLKEEGYAALRILPDKCSGIHSWETKRITEGFLLPQGADTVVESKDLQDYDTLILIEKNFAVGINTQKKE
ncbi:MAG: hypothetical protein ACOYVD_02150 [Bacillota bacterium]